MQEKKPMPSGMGRVCTITGILLGFPAAIYSLYRQLKYFKLV